MSEEKNKEKQVKNTHVPSIAAVKVMANYTRDQFRGVARVDYDTMAALDASTGDIIEMWGTKRTVAKCLPLFASDEGKKLMRIDQLTRENSGLAIGDLAKMKKINAVPAERIVVAAIQDETPPTLDPQYLADSLESIPVINEDKIAIPYHGGLLDFKVEDVQPIGAAAVIITQSTLFVIELPGIWKTIAALEEMHKRMEKSLQEHKNMLEVLKKQLRGSHQKP